MTRPATRLERPKRNVARAWNLPPGSTFIALPHRIISLVTDPSRGFDTRHLAVAVAIADRWHTDEGPVFQVSLRELAKSVNMPKSNIERALRDLEEASLIAVERPKGLRMTIDLRPMFKAAQPPNKLSHPRDTKLSHPRDTTVPPVSHPRDRTVPLPGSRSTQTSEQEEQEVASRGSEQMTANGNGKGKSPAELAAVKAALEALSATKRHPRSINSETYADTQKRLADELAATENDPKDSRPTQASS